ncbi:RNA polymerase sigma factor SigD [Corynebacterium segmentosum]|uniref:RNA polymerase sigma factor SigD n=1 Tax=Corynebacterium segmentosum TaxID=43990 RepID=A0ABY6TBH2_9CORY|nr:RNA polymerase sigma factor SigD [Corynebacterium segmentosum]
MSDKDKELAELVPLAAGGSRRALQSILQIIHPQVLRYCRARIGGGRQPTAEDVTQEICLAVATSIDSYEDKGRPFMAYVYGIAFNKVTDAHRAMGRDRSTPTEELPESTANEATPEEWALENDGSNRMRALLDTLSDKAKTSLFCACSLVFRQKKPPISWGLPRVRFASHSTELSHNCERLLGNN